MWFTGFLTDPIVYKQLFVEHPKLTFWANFRLATVGIYPKLHERLVTVPTVSEGLRCGYLMPAAKKSWFVSAEDDMAHTS